MTVTYCSILALEKVGLRGMPITLAPGYWTTKKVLRRFPTERRFRRRRRRRPDERRGDGQVDRQSGKREKSGRTGQKHFQTFLSPNFCNKLKCLPLVSFFSLV
jgi:hypothetical protein